MYFFELWVTEIFTNEKSHVRNYNKFNLSKNSNYRNSTYQYNNIVMTLKTDSSYQNNQVIEV